MANESEHIVYTEVTNLLLNCKSRLVECVYCKYQVYTELPAPRCGTCKHGMITVVSIKS